MIYLDSAATTMQKPLQVCRAVEAAMIGCGNPGRSGHRPAMQAARIVYDCRELLAGFFGMTEPERVVFTMNATHALNLAIRSQLHGGGHAVISGYEHNSVARPLEAMENVRYTAVHTPVFDREALYLGIVDAVEEDTRCVIVTHVSNVFGFVLPIEELDAFCSRRGIRLIIDASQSAGVLPIDVSRLKSTAFICMPGHKSLYGPQGTGVLLCCKDQPLYSLMQGGTGSDSRSLHQPEMLPDLLESGTLNVCGIAGLMEGVRHLRRVGLQTVAEKEAALAARLADNLRQIPGVRVWYDETAHCGPVSFETEGMPSEEVCRILGERGFCLRGGLHCAPLAHQSAGTLEEGTVRASFSMYNTMREVDLLSMEVRRILSEQIGVKQ